jgi:hypothetical protein
MKIAIRVWTLGYQPFRLGGSLWNPMTTILEADGPHDLGKDHYGYVVTAPTGETKIAEASTGAIVGDTLDQVRADLAEADPEVVSRQMQNARSASNHFDVEPDEFWRRILKGQDR